MDALAVLGVPVLTEGIKFLCEQAKELLLSRRRADDGDDAGSAGPEGRTVALPAAFTGSLDTSAYDPQQLVSVADALIAARSRLENYGSGLVHVDPQNADLRRDVDQLRTLLEAVYGQSITFATEADRPVSGTRVRTVVDVKEVAGKVTVTDIGHATSGEVSAVGKAERVEAGGEFTGTRIEKLGE